VTNVDFFLSSGCAGNVDRDIPAPDDNYLPAYLDTVAHVYIQQEIHCSEYSIEFDAFNLQVSALVRTDCNKNRPEPFALQVTDRKVTSDCRVELELYAETQDGINLKTDQLAWKPVFRDAKREHTSGNRLRFENRNFVTQQRKIVGTRQTGGACANDSDFDPVSFL